MKKTLKDFKKEELKKFCQSCSVEVKELSHITVRTYNTSHRYKGSGRPFIVNHRISVCPKCFNRLNKLILDIVI